MKKEIDYLKKKYKKLDTKFKKTMKANNLAMSKMTASEFKETSLSKNLVK